MNTDTKRILFVALAVICHIATMSGVSFAQQNESIQNQYDFSQQGQTSLMESGSVVVEIPTESTCLCSPINITMNPTIECPMPECPNLTLEVPLLGEAFFCRYDNQGGLHEMVYGVIGAPILSEYVVTGKAEGQVMWDEELHNLRATLTADQNTTTIKCVGSGDGFVTIRFIKDGKEIESCKSCFRCNNARANPREVRC